MPNPGTYLPILPLSVVLFAGGFIAADDRLTFEQHVRPILKTYCLDCHGGGEELKAHLDLRLKRFAERGGDSGPAIVPGKPAESLLVERIKSGEMPPGEKKLSVEQIAVIERWIEQGAAANRAEPESLPPGIDITPEERSFWAFQPVRRMEPPVFSPNDRVRTPVDAWILVKLRDKGLSFASEADRRTLIRRATFDLTGLPPTPQEIDAFVAEEDPRAWETLIDRLLDSPHYGERWARHWLDVAGYADSDGDGTNDSQRPFAYKYRDYVIRSLNADKPLDQFLIEQLAGDELIPRPASNLSPEQIDLLTATGFLRMAVDQTAAGGDRAEVANQVVADTLKIVSSGLLGLTVGCAQCHDHRYDPIPQSDYYRLRAVFDPAWNAAAWKPPAARLVSLMTDSQRAERAKVEAEESQQAAAVQAKQQEWIAKVFDVELERFPEADREALRTAFKTPAEQRTADQKKLVETNPKLDINPGVLYQYSQQAADEVKKLNDQLAAIRARKPVEEFVHALLEDAGVNVETKLFHRGDYRQPKQSVGPGDLTIAAPEGARFEITPKDPQVPTTGRRLAFAKHLVDGKHPLVGRVLVNRIWLNHFGRGLVDTPGDFGTLGLRPTHPELLDWLADELVRRRWSLKELHRLIMTSTVYRQSSRRDPANAADSENSLYGRFPIRRLDAESLRDQFLAVSGRLERKLFGPPVALTEDFVGQVLAADDSPRRSLYLQVRRSKPVSFLTTFDAPVMTVNCDRRVPSTTAPQSLMLMNSEFVLNHARSLATRVRSEMPADFAREATAALAARYPRPGAAWQYGYGSYDDQTKRIAQFTHLAHWTGSHWQGGAALPDPNVGWTLLRAGGGHAGNDPQHAAIRRFVSPRSGTLVITGKLKHDADGGDGVRGRIVSSREGLAGEWIAKKQSLDTVVSRLPVSAGDTLDFAIDCIGDVNCDSFEWTAELRLVDEKEQTIATWNTESEFHGPLQGTLPQWTSYAWHLVYQRPVAEDELQWACEFLSEQLASVRGAAANEHEMNALTNLCQQLLNSNEFLYVD